ncbi:signal transduction protein TRAP [Staphylococcus casei]|uniref:signal transduction protein TRAP n=1 Tax=Staphylococcus TaxID=1279 RepID=UPI000CD2B554|nr:signal transduction protein TRAP [Staphylococcus casei]PNZ56553.1 signal transduction protein TRAP [Staphylococcus casei]PTI75721.1 signal transduction protein TRAP [Staphylococcus succinus]WJE87351.1 signal transduction protein TRAP [Staphylococcus casei]
MKIYASYGTFGYLNQIRLNNLNHNLLQFSASDSSVILEETEEQSVLKQPLVYDILMSDGTLDENYFYSVIFVPTSEDHAYQLEKKLENVTTDFKNFAGYRCYRFLKPEQGLTYKIYFGFESRTAYEDFKSSSVFSDNFDKLALSQFFGSSGQHSSYFERYLFPIDDN